MRRQRQFDFGFVIRVAFIVFLLSGGAMSQRTLVLLVVGFLIF